MTNRSEYEPKSKVHSENVHPETIPTVEKTPKSKRIGVVEEVPVRRETVTTTDSNKSKKSKPDYGPSLPILAAIACCIPLAGILGYLIRGERVVTRTITQTVPVLTVPASPVVTPAPVSPAPSAVSPSPVGPEVVGPETVGPARVGPARVGPDRVGNK